MSDEGKRITELDLVTTPAADDTFAGVQGGENYEFLTSQILRSPVDVHNVKHYGATGDGATDDATAIQAAIDAAEAAGGGTVFFPVGTYLINSTLTMDQGIYLEGVSPRASIISSDVVAAEWAIIVTRTGSRYSLTKMGGINKLKLVVNIDDANGLRVIDGFFYSLREFVVDGGNNSGVRAAIGISMEYGSSGSAYCLLDHVYISFCVIALVVDGGVAAFANRYRFSAVHIFGLLPDSTHGAKLANCDTHTGFIELENVTNGVYMDAVHHCTLTVTEEGGTTSIELVNNCLYNKIFGNFGLPSVALTSETGTVLFTNKTVQLPTKVGFFGTTETDQAANITNPAGGGVVDAEARTAIDAILTALEGIGITST